MAIVSGALKLGKKLLKNKSLQKALNITTKQTNKLKDVAKAGATKAGKATLKSTATATKAGAKKAMSATKAGAKKALKATKAGVKKASKVTGAAAAAGVAGAAKSATSATKAGAKKVIEKTKAGASSVGTKLKDVADKSSGATLGGMASGISAGVSSGVASAKSVGAKGIASAKKLAGKDPFTAGMITQGAIDLPLTVGAVALTASMMKSSAPKEAQYKQERLPDGRFVTGFSDANKNNVYTQKQLSSKETDEVRSLVALLDSIILSEDPSKRRKEFTQTAQLLGGKYGVSHITGKNLSIMMPTVMGNNRTLR